MAWVIDLTNDRRAESEIHNFAAGEGSQWLSSGRPPANPA